MWACKDSLVGFTGVFICESLGLNISVTDKTIVFSVKET